MSDITSRYESLARKMMYAKESDKEGLVFTWIRQGIIRNGKEFKMLLNHLRPKTSTNIKGDKNEKVYERTEKELEAI